MLRKLEFREHLTGITNILIEYLCAFTIIYHLILLRIRDVSEKCCGRNTNHNFVFRNNPPKIVPFVNNVEKLGRARQVKYYITGCFIMHSGITKIYYKKTEGNVFTKPETCTNRTTQKFFLLSKFIFHRSSHFCR